MPPKLKTDDLIEAILDGKVVEALAKALSPFLKKIIDESLDDKLATLTKTVSDVQQSNAKLQAQMTMLKKENDDMRVQLTTQGGRLESIEAYSRLDNLIIKGLPETSYAERASKGSADADESLHAESNSSVESTVISFCRDALHVAVTPSDISIAHRLRTGGKDKVRPVIIRFTNRRIRDSVFRAKKLLKNQSKPIYISEHLTKSSSELFYESRKLLREKKIHSTWTNNGQVFVKVSANPSAKPLLIKCHADLSVLPNG